MTWGQSIFWLIDISLVKCRRQGESTPVLGWGCFGRVFWKPHDFCFKPRLFSQFLNYLLNERKKKVRKLLIRLSAPRCMWENETFTCHHTPIWVFSSILPWRQTLILELHQLICDFNSTRVSLTQCVCVFFLLHAPCGDLAVAPSGVDSSPSVR